MNKNKKCVKFSDRKAFWVVLLVLLISVSFCWVYFLFHDFKILFYMALLVICVLLYYYIDIIKDRME